MFSHTFKVDYTISRVLTLCALILSSRSRVYIRGNTHIAHTIGDHNNLDLVTARLRFSSSRLLEANTPCAVSSRAS